MKWIEEFLKDRWQHVAVEGVMSGDSPVRSGVPQGLVLGPFLFLVHIGDMTDVTRHSRVSSFADDTRLLKQIKSIEDCNLLQQDLKEIYEWAKQTNMFFNGSKFVLLRYSASGDVIDYTYASSENSPIPEEDRTTDLGVIMSKSVNFKDHIADVAARGRQRVG